jgi:hypothetical protein
MGGTYWYYCGRDRGMPKGKLYECGRHGNDGKAEPRDTLGRKLLSSLSVSPRYL